MDASPYSVSMSNDSALASRWFWSLCYGKPDDSGRKSNGENQTARIMGSFDHSTYLIFRNTGVKAIDGQPTISFRDEIAIFVS